MIAMLPQCPCVRYVATIIVISAQEISLRCPSVTLLSKPLIFAGIEAQSGRNETVDR